MSAINDPLGQTHSPAISSDHYSHLKVLFVLRDFEKTDRRTDVLTDNMSENSDQYQQWLSVGRVDQ